MPLSGKDVCDEVAWRLNNRLTASATGAGSLINMTNDMLGLISSAASWIWDLTFTTQGMAGDKYAPVLMDAGKKISCWNSNGTIIERSDQGDDESLSVGYLNVQSSVYNHFRMTVDPISVEPFLYFYPTGLNGTVTVRYSLRPPTLAYNTSPTVRWLVPEMDALLKDWTEAQACRILKMSGWQQLWQDCQGRIGEFKVKWSTERINTGPAGEMQEIATEKQIGRE